MAAGLNVVCRGGSLVAICPKALVMLTVSFVGHDDLPHRAAAGRVVDGRGSLGHAATLRFPSPLIEPDVPISGIRLSDWLHREAHGATVRARSRRSTPRSP